MFARSRCQKSCLKMRNPFSLVFPSPHQRDYIRSCKDLWESFHREIRATIASSYFNRFCPTLAEVERSFAENLPEGNKELQAHLIFILTMCARKAPDTYHILPPCKSRQPIIFLAQTPSDFVSFLDPEKDTVEADWLALDKACQDDKFSLHHYLRHAANEIREKVPNHFRHKPLAEVENLLHLAVGQGKLVAWDDTWRPKHVADDLMSKLEERIQGMTNHRSWTNAKRGWSNNRNARWSERAASKGPWEEFRPKEPQPEFDVEQSQWPSLAEAVHPPNDRSAWIDRPKGLQVWPDETSSFSGTSVRTSAHEDVEIASEELAHKILPIMLSFPEGIGLSMLKKEAAAVDLALWERNPVTLGPFDKQDCNADSAHLRAMRATSLLCFPSSFADLEDEQDEEEPVVFKGLSAPSSQPADSGDTEGQDGQSIVLKGKPDDLLAMVDEDMGLSTAQLPEDVTVTSVFTWVHFRMRCDLDLKSVSCKLRNAEYNPQKGVNRMLLRLLQPSATATLWASGNVHCCVKGDGDGQVVARRITRLVQKCGYPDATCRSFRLVRQQLKADLCFPIRLEGLAQKWSRHVLYVPDVCCAASLFLKHPPCSMQIWASGKLTAVAENLETGREAIRRVYSLLREFSQSGQAVRLAPNLSGTPNKEVVEQVTSFQSTIEVKELVDLEELHCEGATLKVLFTPGHANDHICLFLEEEKALFTGDNVLGWGTGTFQDLQPYMKSLKRMAAQVPRVLYPAHGPAIAGAEESAAWLKMYISHREERIHQVAKELRASKNGLDLVELVKRVYKAQPEVMHSSSLFRGACFNTQVHQQPGRFFAMAPAPESAPDSVAVKFDIKETVEAKDEINQAKEENEGKNQNQSTGTLPDKPVRLYVNREDQHLGHLEVYSYDHVGLLFKICELLTSHGVDICSAQINTENGVVYNHFDVRIARPSDTAACVEWCRELEELLEKTRGPAFDNSLANVSKRLSVNPDLVSVVTFVEKPPQRDELCYKLVLEGINQAGLLTYTALVLYRCGFSISTAQISTTEGHIVDTFELTTTSAESESLLRSYLDVPMPMKEGQQNTKEVMPLPFHATESDADLQALMQMQGGSGTQMSLLEDSGSLSRVNSLGEIAEECSSKDRLSRAPSFSSDTEQPSGGAAQDAA
eukprot:symbB.v1.2.016296.t2/scaffold1236.1/size130149/14